MSTRLDALPQRPLPGGLGVAEAETWKARFLGLAWLDGMPDDRALHLRPCRSVHTFGMRFALDLIWLDGDGKVIQVDREVRPRRLRNCRRARSVIEAAAGRGDAFVAAAPRLDWSAQPGEPRQR